MSVISDAIADAYKKGFIDGQLKHEAAEPERKFVRIDVSYPPEDLCPYDEYKGKPYYGIVFAENCETVLGFGTYDPDVLSRYLKEYFINAGNSGTPFDSIIEDIKAEINNIDAMTFIGNGSGCASEMRAECLKIIDKHLADMRGGNG